MIFKRDRPFESSRESVSEVKEQVMNSNERHNNKLAQRWISNEPKTQLSFLLDYSILFTDFESQEEERKMRFVSNSYSDRKQTQRGWFHSWTGPDNSIHTACDSWDYYWRIEQSKEFSF